MKSGVIWITGLSGAGKTTFATAIYDYLKPNYPNAILLDGDILRSIFKSNDYTKESRLQTAIRFNSLIAFLEKNDLLVIAATISAFNKIYKLNRETFQNYFEIYIHCDFNELARRDKNGLYSGALKGEIPNVVGVDIPFEEPQAHFVLENSELGGIPEKTKLLCAQVDDFLKKI